MNKIHDNFLIELFKLCLKNKDVLEICKEYLQYHYLPTEAFKEIWKRIVSKYTVNNRTLPTVGTLIQSFDTDDKSYKEIEDTLAKIKECPTPEKDIILNTFEEYIMQAMVMSGFSKSIELWNSGKKDDSMKEYLKNSEKLRNFKLNKSAAFSRVIGDLETRQAGREIDLKLGLNIKKKVYFGIDQIDELTGGVEEGELVGFLAQSGVGKTKLLRYIGMHNALLGHDVLHIQLEGSKSEALRGYDSLFTGLTNYEIDNCLKGDVLYEALRDIKSMSHAGDVHVIAHETFNSASTLDVRNACIEFEKIHGKAPEMVMIDYFELLTPGLKHNQHFNVGTTAGEKARRIAIGQELKNIAIEQKTRIFCPTQASAVPQERLDDPTFHMTRYDCSGDKNFVNPFSYFFTLNQTTKEGYEGVMRIWVEKLRHQAKGRGDDERLIQIYQSYKYDRFYDRERTLRSLKNRFAEDIIKNENKK